VFSRRRVAGGLTCAAAGAMALALSVGSPAGATEGPQVETGPGWSAGDLADRFGGQWAEAQVPAESGRHLLDDRGTPDTSDDAYVDVQVNGDEISWSSDGVAIGAVEVEGGDESRLYTFGGGHGSRHGEFDWGGHGDRGGDRDRGGWGGGHGWGDRGGHRINFCWKKGGGGGHQPPPSHPPMTPPTHPPTTAPPTTAPPTTAPPTTAPPETTTTTAPPETTTTLPQTEATTPTTQPAGEQLPETGSTTMPLVVGAAALLGIGAAAFFGRRYLQQKGA
jgi:LPXTG-motif cell wall-anchored protein